LVLGVLALAPFSLFAGIPAIITGHLAHKRSKRSPAEYGGGGLAIAGFVMGYVSLPLALVILPPALTKAKAKAQRIACVNNLKNITLAATMWAGDHQDNWPSNFISFQKELGTPGILWCPGDTARKAAVDWSAVGPSNISYEFVSPGDTGDYPFRVLFRCPIHGNVALADGSAHQVRRP
jgi:hypothetical protein